MPLNSRFGMRTEIALLEMGKSLDLFSMAFTLATSCGLALTAFYHAQADPVVIALLGLSLLTGVAEKYHALRVAYDAAIFRALLEEQGSLEELDAVLKNQFGRKPRPDFDIANRLFGARRILARQASSVALQIFCFVAALAWATIHPRLI